MTTGRFVKANGRDKPWKVSVFAIGNETWGCGGKMRAPYYADRYNRYATFMKTARNPKPVMLASGDPDGMATDFTAELMANRRAPISLHYYTVLGPAWSSRRRIRC